MAEPMAADHLMDAALECRDEAGFLRRVVGPATPVIAGARRRRLAFAAEFLAPAAALRARLAGDSPVEPERTDDLAREFDVSSEVIRRQIRNHDLATIVEY